MSKKSSSSNGSRPFDFMTSSQVHIFTKSTLFFFCPLCITHNRKKGNDFTVNHSIRPPLYSQLDRRTHLRLITRYYSRPLKRLFKSMVLRKCTLPFQALLTSAAAASAPTGVTMPHHRTKNSCSNHVGRGETSRSLAVQRLR